MNQEPTKACPICEKPILDGETVEWAFELDGVPTVFAIQCCRIDAYLCRMFPSLKKTLARSETVAMILKRLTDVR